MKTPLRRFWTAAEARESDAGFAVALDGRPLRTPLGAPFAAPCRAAAEAAAAEWSAQGETPDPRTMPVTRAINTGLDRAGREFEPIAALLTEYAGSDLLCYRAPGPGSLIARQSAAWDPALDWAAEAFGARLICAEGVMHVDQPPEALAALGAAVRARTPFQLVALHDLVALSGSLVLGLAVAEGRLTAEAAWTASRIDEDFQTERWGEDAEAAAAAQIKRDDFFFARRFLDLLAEP
ncbi:MAG: ATP12 family protein [Pseudomonadota bacterium]